MLKKTLIYAHRGANQLAAENTRHAFDLSLQQAINGIETDVQLSADNVALLWHDDDLQRLGLAQRTLDEYDSAALQQLNFSAHFPLASRSDKMMRLDDFISRYRARTRLLLEIKNRPHEAFERIALKVNQTLSCVGQHQADEVLISSFEISSLSYAHQCAESFPLVLNLEPFHTYADVQQTLQQHIFLRGYCLHISRLDLATVNLLRSHNKLIAVYTCNSHDEISHALNLGVDILISDVPEHALLQRDHAT